jgi:hypothetical protein
VSATDHLANAREYIAIAEAGDSKLEAWKHAADEIIAWIAEDPTRSYREASRRLGRGKDYCGQLVRWRTSAPDPGHLPFGGEDENEARYQRQTNTALKDPERRQAAIAALPTEQVEQIIEEAHTVVLDRVQAQKAEHDTAARRPTAGDLMGESPYNPSESWADTDIIRVREKAHALRRQVERWGLVLGSLDEAQAFDYLQEAERNIAEVRVVLQERMADRSRAEV